MLVDDDADLRRIAAVMLRREGADVTEACGGIEAITLLRAGDFDAILTDLHMSLGDGYSLIGSIRPRMRSRVVIVTGCPVMLDGAGGASAFGVRFVLPKPHSMPAMVEATRLAVAAGRCDFNDDACPVRAMRPARRGATVLPDGLVAVT